MYYVYCKYCDKDYLKEKQEYGYSDLTEHICKYRDCQQRCENYFERSNKK